MTAIVPRSLAGRGLGVTYRARRGPVVALADADLTVRAGEGCAVVGPSGSGKSTLLHLLLRLQRPDSGEVLLDGRPVRGRSDERRFRRAVQFVPQDPAGSLDPRRTVLAQVREPLRRLRVEGDHRARVVAALADVGLDEALLTRRAHQISGGQAQRIAIARALVTGPAFLLADEPVSGLDPPRRAQVLRLLAQARLAHGIGVVMVTHDLGSVAGVCDRTVVLARGRVVEDRPTDDVLGDPQHETARRLVAAIPRPATDNPAGRRPPGQRRPT